MKSFRRIFKYILPQWPRVIIVVLSAFLVSVLLSLSFLTIIPLLKVMMNQEGLHGWVDRKTCSAVFGMDFFVPDVPDIMSGENQDLVNYLIVTKVKKDSLAEKGGIKVNDKIIASGNVPAEPNEGKRLWGSAGLLQKLATTKEKQIKIQISRSTPQGASETKTIVLNTPLNTDYIDSLPLSGINRLKLHLASSLTNYAQSALKALPRERGIGNQTRAVIFIILMFGVVTIIRCFAKFYQSYLAEKVVQIGINHLRRDAFWHVMNMPIGYFANERPSDTVSRLVRDTGAMGNGIKILLGKALREPMNAAILLAAAALLNWQLTLIFLCGAPATIWLVSLLGKKMKRASKKSLMAWSQMLAKLQETMTGLKVVKVYNQQGYEKEQFESINKRLLKQLLKISKVDAATMPVLEVLGMAAGSAALIAGASWVANKHLEATDFFVLLILLGTAAEAVRKTSDIWNKIQEAEAAADRVFSIMDEPLESQQPNAVELAPLKNTIEFRNVFFSYPGAIAPVLKNINLTIKAGHNIALVGPNGSGKTTLANLIPRFYDPDCGQVLIDDTDIKNVSLSSLRNQIGMVTQEVVTFNDTIAANIAYGRTNATMDEIINAAKKAYAHEFITLLPDNYQTIIGEQGMGLSGGQLQRIVIARAILKNPPILIFDEATSQIDADSEAKIHRALEEIMQNRTSIIIAHRFSTIIKADVIVVLDKGQIVAEGQHSELIKTCRLYQSLYENQLIMQD